MLTRQVSIPVSDSIGKVSAEIIEPAEVNALYVFAHGAGAGMQHPFLTRLSQALADRRIATLRFNFPFVEKRSKRPDPAPIAEKTVSMAIQAARVLYPDTTLLAGGKSFGGRMSSHVLSKNNASGVAGIVFAGFPLHAPGKPGTDRAAHLEKVSLPMLFLQGTRDTLADITLVEKVCRSLPRATLQKFEGADHSFKAGKSDLIPALAEAVSSWLSGSVGKS